MRIIIADSLKIYNTLLNMNIPSILWTSNTSLFSICDRNTDITHIIAPQQAINLEYNKKCLEEYNKIKFIPINNIINGVDLISINNITDIKITGEYVLYIDGFKTEESLIFLRRFLNEKCPYNIRIVGPNKIMHYKYIGFAQDNELLNLIKYSQGCINYDNNHIYDIAFLEKPCITMMPNELFNDKLEYSKIDKNQLPTLEQNIKQHLNDDSTER